MFIVFALSIALYANTFGHQYALDDLIVTRDNAFVNQGIGGMGKILGEDSFLGYYQNQQQIVAGGRYRPLSLVTFALEREFTKKPNPQLSHVINVVLYALGNVLLFTLLYALFRQKGKDWWFSVPFFASLLFVAHPLHTEVVANIKGRDEILALFGSLATLWFALRYADQGKAGWLVWAFVCFFLALLSKENAITWLVLVPMGVYYFRTSPRKSLWRITWPLAIAALVFLLVRQSIIGGAEGHHAIQNDIMNNPFAEAGLADKYATISYTLGLYLKLLVYPHPLTFDYYPRHIPIIGWADWRALVPLLLYIGMLWAGIAGLRRKKLYSYSIWLYLLPLSIVSNIIFPVGAFMSERFMYFSSLGFVLVLAWLLVARLPRLFSAERTGRVLSLVLLAAIIGLYAFKTIDRNRAWVDSYTLFVTDVQVSGNSAKSQASAGEYIMQKAMSEKDPQKKKELFDKAMHHLSRTLEIHPRHVLALFNQAAVYWYNERNYRAMFANYYKILKIAPGHPKVYDIIRQVMPLIKDPAFKREALMKIREIDGPRYMTSFMLGELYFTQYKDYVKARKYINEALQKNPQGREAMFYNQKLAELGH